MDDIVQILKKSGLVIIPTETVYGIAVDATNNLAVDKLYSLKKRSTEKPLQIMCASIEKAREIGKFSSFANLYCDKIWPGPLTAVVEKKEPSVLAENFNINDSSVGIRIPRHPKALTLLKECNFPLAVTSANISGKDSASGINEIAKEILDLVDHAIDGGPCDIGVSSTVVDFRADPPKILRQGSLELSF